VSMESGQLTEIKVEPVISEPLVTEPSATKQQLSELL